MKVQPIKNKVIHHYNLYRKYLNLLNEVDELEGGKIKAYIDEVA